jgi:LmbE family N-acetylglucosaminyl deacetylase
MIAGSRILILAPHTDDGELGCGGTISYLLEKGCEVFSCAFSPCERSLPAGFPPGTLRDEMYKATELLGMKKENVYVLDYDVRVFPEHRQQILDDMIRMKNDLNPDMVFVPSALDVHQDHHVIYQEGLRAFKYSTVLTYELPWNQFSFQSSYLVRLEERHIEKKIAALAAYKSQAHRPYTIPDFTRSLAMVRGVQAGSKYAEAFEVVKIIA